MSGRAFSRSDLVRQVWELSFTCRSPQEIRSFLSLSDEEFRDIRAEAMTTFEPSPEQIRAVKESWA